MVHHEDTDPACLGPGDWILARTEEYGLHWIFVMHVYIATVVKYVHSFQAIRVEAIDSFPEVDPEERDEEYMDQIASPANSTVLVCRHCSYMGTGLHQIDYGVAPGPSHRLSRHCNLHCPLRLLISLRAVSRSMRLHMSALPRDVLIAIYEELVLADRCGRCYPPDRFEVTFIPGSWWNLERYFPAPN